MNRSARELMGLKDRDLSDLTPTQAQYILWRASDYVRRDANAVFILRDCIEQILRKD